MVRLNRIYTRTGDDGSTGLVDGSRVPKHDALMAAIGAVDEANSAIGLAAVHAHDDGGLADLAALRRIQSELFDLGADFAMPGTVFAEEPTALRMTARQITRLETEIDAMTARLMPLTSFILPGGTPLAAALHMARALVRRAERLGHAASVRRPLNPRALAYLNRLSDWLFVAARMANNEGRADILWIPGATR